MPINTSNVGGLQISQGSEDINFTPQDTSLIYGKITNSLTVNNIVYHGWKLAQPVPKSEQRLEEIVGKVGGTVPTTVAQASQIRNPIVTLDNATLTAGTYVYAKFRSLHSTYGAIFDGFTSGAGNNSTTIFVAAAGTIMEWRGEFHLGLLKLYDFADNWYVAQLSSIGAHGWRFYSSNQVYTKPVSWLFTAGSSLDPIVPQSMVVARSLTFCVGLPCTYVDAPVPSAVWQGFTVAEDRLGLLKAKHLANGGQTWRTMIMYNGTQTVTPGNSGWTVINVGNPVEN